MLQQPDEQAPADAPTRTGRPPDFLGIGGQKAGTTWLDRNLRHHDQVFLPQRKELHFLDREFGKGRDHYLAYFADAGDRIAGEITPDYMKAPRRKIRWMRDLTPDARLVLLIRNPLERAWSAAKYYLRNQHDATPDDLSAEEMRELFTRPFMLARGRYLDAIDRWGGVFGQEQLQILFYDDIVEAPEETLRAVMRHIGVDDTVDLADYPLRKAFNKGPEGALEGEHRRFLAGLFREEVEGLAARYGGHASRWLEDLDEA